MTAEQKTAKNRLKRQRHKNNARSSQKGQVVSGEGGDDVIESSTADAGTGIGGGEIEKKRKIGSGVGIKFTRPEDREDDDEEEMLFDDPKTLQRAIQGKITDDSAAKVTGRYYKEVDLTRSCSLCGGKFHNSIRR